MLMKYWFSFSVGNTDFETDCSAQQKNTIAGTNNNITMALNRNFAIATIEMS